MQAGSTSIEHGKWDLLILFLFCPLLLTGCLFAPFLPFDDAVHVATPQVLGETPLLSVITTLPRISTFFPVTILSYRFEYSVACELFGVRNWAPVVRIDNLLLHMLAGFGVWSICRALSFGRAARLFITGAFLLHPMACESVCWVSERKNVLAAAFGFGSLAVLLNRKPGPRRSFLCGVLFLFAVFSKPSALGLLPVILAIEVVNYVQSRELARDPNYKSTLWPLFEIFVVTGAAVASLVLNLITSATTLVKPPGGTVFTAILTDSDVLLRYVKNLLFPVQLSAFYYVKPIVSVAEPRFLLNLGLIIAIVWAAIFLSVRRQLVVFLLFSFVAILGPVLNLLSLSFVMQDRYVYLASPALFAIVALVVEGLAVRLSARQQNAPSWNGIALASTAGVLLVYTGFAASRSFVWEDTYTLFEDAVQKEPQSIFSHMYLGTTLIKVADRMESQSPQNPQIPILRTQAVAHLETACRSDELSRLVLPTQPFNALAIVQIKRGKLDEAERAARYCVDPANDPSNDLVMRAEAHKHLAQIMMERQHYENVIKEADLALEVKELSHEPEPWLLKGRAFEKLGKVEEAVSAYRNVVKGSTQYASAQMALKQLTAQHAAQNDTNKL